MDYGPTSGNVVHVISEPWASEEEYRVWNNVDTHPETPSRSGSEPPNKKSRNTIDSSSSSSSARSKAIGKMFFKTKVCCKFRAGTCPYVTNCNFAHSVEELRRPPPNWQDIVAAHEDEREEFQIPSVGSSGFAGESQRSYKGRHCKKFYTDEGCPYGENCTFLHDVQSKNRESVAISLGPGGYSGGGGGGGGGCGGGSGGGGGGVVIVVGGGGNGSTITSSAAGAVLGVNLKPSNWKTRICNKWEITGYCPFGSKCHFAHGAAELHHYGGGLMESENRDSSSATPPDGGGVPSKAPGDIASASGTSALHSDIYNIGVPSQRTAIIIHRPAQRIHQKWKGPDKISRIYGDWIDEME